ncbi:MAG: hypothetical protein OJF49_002853 [Ktedonobacterales bacterium]|jgi:hypothetical protein|nr:MAG: hypothetical protein OJF49_002853 [Ktedonobacterales bacterium]
MRHGAAMTGDMRRSAKYAWFVSMPLGGAESEAIAQGGRGYDADD